MSPKEYQSKLPPSKVLGIGPDPIADLLNRTFSRRGAIKLFTMAAGELWVSGCGAAPQPPQGSIQSQAPQVRDSAQYFGVPKTQVLVAATPFPTPSRGEPLRPTRIPTPTAVPTLNPVKVEPPKPTPQPTAQREPTRKPGIVDSFIHEGPLAKQNIPKNSLGDPALDPNSKVDQKVQEAMAGKLPGNAEAELKRHILHAKAKAVGEKQYVTVSHPNVFESKGNTYGIQVSCDEFGNMDVTLKNMSTQMPTEIKLNFYNVGDGETEMAAGIFTKYLKDGFIYEDPQLNAFRHTIQIIRIVQEVSPETTSRLTRFKALWPGYTKERFGMGSNAGAYEEALVRIASKELKIENPNPAQQAELAKKEVQASQYTFTSFLVQGMNLMLNRRTSPYPEKFYYWYGEQNPKRITPREYVKASNNGKFVAVDFKFGDK